MTLPVVTVVIPTIEGREDHYARCRDSYTATAEGHCELDLITVLGEPSCGWGWQAGAERMSRHSQYLHFTCDDIEALPGWVEPAIEALDQGCLPAPRVLNGHTGAPEYFPKWGIEWPDWTVSGMAGLPFMTRDLWDRAVSPMFTGHYWTDNWVTWRAEQAGYVARVRTGFAFRHWWAAHARGAGMGYEERLAHDGRLFQQAAAMAQRGEWVKPWPDRGAVT
jgi:hypothetical protein